MVNFLGNEEEITPADWEQVQHEIDLVKRDPFDPAPLIDLFKSYHSEIDKMANKSMGLMVKDDQTLELATTMTTQAKALAQAVEKKRVEVKAPYLEVVKVLDGETKGLKDRLLQIQGHINGKIQPYLQEKDRKRQEDARKAAEEAARIQRELDEKARIERERAEAEAKAAALAAGMTDEEASRQGEAAAAMVEDAPVVVSQNLPDETKVQTDTGTAKLKEKWIGELVDIRAITPECIKARWEELKKALQPYINAQIAAGARNVPGFKIYKTATVETRTSKSNFKF